jgi:hypothetical protein
MKKASLLLITLSFSVKALAWDGKAHRLIAQIAKSRVEKSTAELIDHYLQGTSWEDAATSLDAMKADPKNDYMKPWHYIYIDKDKTYVKTREPNIINQLENCINLLQRRSLLNVQIINQQIRNLFHLVGDLHQPLHCGYGTDKGGDLAAVKFLGKPSNLHRVWDTQIIDEKGIDMWSCSKVLMSLTPQQLAEIQKTDIQSWLADSRALLPKVYDFKNGNIDQQYIEQNAAVINMQLTKAGLRLAAVLNQYFKP